MAFTPDGCQQTQFTGTDGTYQFHGMFAGTYEVVFNDPRYVPQYWHDQASASTATPISVAFGSTTLGIDATLTRSG